MPLSTVFKLYCGKVINNKSDVNQSKTVGAILVRMAL